MRSRSLILVLFVAFALSPFSELFAQNPMTKKTAQNIEKVLRKLILDEKPSIQKDALFVYEKDTFSGGLTILDSGRASIGKWQITLSGKKAKATIEDMHGASGRYESANLEVDLELVGNSFVVRDWRAYQTWGTIK